MKKLFLLLQCIIVAVFAAEDSSPIVVQLATEVPLMPVYVAPLQDDQNALSREYLNSLEKVLQFDLNHNGMTYVVKKNAELEKLNKETPFDSNQDLSPWLNHQVYFIVKTKIKDKQLSAKLMIVNSNSTKYIEGLTLKGDLNQDRKIIHTLSDKIHKALFGKDGIASTRFLYSVKMQNPQKKWISEIFEADYDGANVKQITKDGGYCVTPAYIPPREGYKSGSCVFVSYKIGQPKIYLASLKDGQMQRFSLLKGNQLMPTISRQKDKIAFISDVTGNPDLFLQDFDVTQGALNKPRQLYATHKATQGTPTFSPDGKRIAFVSNKDGSPRIYVMDIPPVGTSIKDIKAQLISKINRENTAPCWSPDGSKIAYCSSTKGVRQIWMYDFNTRSERQLTQGPGNKENPTWAPNSLHLIFNSTDANESELYLINLNQKEATKISFGPGEKHFPSWEPIY